jgi:hypothetical protein
MSSSVDYDPAGALGADAPSSDPHRTTIEPRALITGRVRRPDDTALAGASVTVVDTAGRQCGFGRTDSHGWYRCPVPGPGEYLLVCACPPYRSDAMRVVADATGASADMMVATAAMVTGRVLRAGTIVPVPDVVLILIDERGSATARTVSDESGRYRIADLPEGRYTLTACCGDHDPVAIGLVLPAAETVTHDVVLNVRAALAGTVRSATSGLPLPESLVTVLDSEGRVVAHTATGRDGTFGVPDLRESEYTVIASGFPPAAIVTSVWAGARRPVELTLGEARE